MKSHLKTLAALTLVSTLVAGHAQTTAPATSSKKSTTHKRPAKSTVPPKPSVENQIRDLRQEMQTQIEQLKQQLSERDQQLQQAQQSAAAAQAAAEQAQQQAAQQASAVTQNSQQVSTLQSAVSDLTANNASLVSTIQADQAKVQAAISNPDAIHFKGATLSPTGSFLAAETVYRNHATGSDINTGFSAVPYPGAPQAHYSEFYGSGRQSRLALLATGKVSDSLKIGGYYESDFLSAATTSNNNQSNSYSLRQRQLWAQAQWNSLTFTGGQQWSLLTETKTGMDNRTEALPQSIDAQYVAGFDWARQYGFRVVKNFENKFWLGVSIENPQIASVGGHNFPTNFVIGQAGTAGGLYNPTANYASNLAPDIIAKIAVEPGWGHYEVWGLARFYRARVYPNIIYNTANPNGIAANTIGAYNDDTTGGAIGGSLRVPTLHKHLDVGIKGAWGDGGLGRYGSSGEPDLTVGPGGQLALLHDYSGLGTLELHATPRLDVYFNYGGDGTFRRYFVNRNGTIVGYGAPTFSNTGCYTEPVPGAGGYAPGSPSCTGDVKNIVETTLGYWYDFYKGPAGRLRQGIQYSYITRNAWSGVGGAPKGIDNMVFTSFRYYMP